jgi:hypothetical protein
MTLACKGELGDACYRLWFPADKVLAGLQARRLAGVLDRCTRYAGHTTRNASFTLCMLPLVECRAWSSIGARFCMLTPRCDVPRQMTGCGSSDLFRGEAKTFFRSQKVFQPRKLRHLRLEEQHRQVQHPHLISSWLQSAHVMKIHRDQQRN